MTTQGHRTLRDVNDLAAAVKEDACLYLPERLHRKAVWAYLGPVLFAWSSCYFFLFVLQPSIATAWWGIALVVGTAVGMCWWQMRRFAYRVRWVLNMSLRTLQPAHTAGPAIPLDPAHSIGIMSGPPDHSSLSCEVEFRHRTAGPIATLFEVELQSSDTETLSMQMGTLDRCVDELAARLGVRRSGGRLTPAY